MSQEPIAEDEAAEALSVAIAEASLTLRVIDMVANGNDATRFALYQEARANYGKAVAAVSTAKVDTLLTRAAPEVFSAHNGSREQCECDLCDELRSFLSAGRSA